MGVNNLLSIGTHALFAHQVALNVTGNNVANVDTEGYARQSVRFEEFRPMDTRPGQIGMGAYAAEVYRNFNRFIENSYLERFTQQQHWAEQSTIMRTVENIFNEANRDGISSQLSSFFNLWNTLAATPDSMATREALFAQADNLALLLRDANASLESIQREMDSYINQAVNDVNDILDRILDINKQIAVTHVPGVNNANSLFDERDKLVRQLSELVDVKVVDKGGADFQIFTESGHPLFGEMTVYKLQFNGPSVEKQTEGFFGDLVFSGSDSQEYTLEFVDSANFRVSLDGGKSWLRDEDGQISTFTAPPAGQTIQVKNLEISFDYKTGDFFRQGDTFLIVPKTGLYWDSPTREPLNVTPQISTDGVENDRRITGGKLTAYFQVRDYHVGRYIDKLDALAKSLAWEVNSLHSQGAGLEKMTNMQGTYEVKRTDLPLGSLYSGMTYSQNLSAGNMSLYFFDGATGQSIPDSLGTDVWRLDFSSVIPPGSVNFDPTVHTLEDVADVINSSFPNPGGGGNMLTASIEGGKLHITAASGVNFQMGTDTTGLMAALGLNTFFQGESAGDISINPMLKYNLAYINAQSLDGQDEGNAGDGLIASRIAQLASSEVRVSTVWENSGAQSLNSYYGGLVGLVGAETQAAIFNEQYNTSMAEDLDARASAITGVNLDEEMTNLIRFQHSYTAAAKLITTADQMLETILGLKQ